MNLLADSPFLKALGWTLLNSLWQFGALWLLFFVFINVKKTLSPAVKHGVALFVMSAGFVWFAAGLSFQYFFYSESADNTAALYNLHTSTVYILAYQAAKTFLEKNLSYLSVFYLLVVAGFFTRFFRVFFYSHTIQTRGLSKLKAELRLYVEQLEQRLNIRYKVKVWISEYIDTPMVMGFLRPTILIPIACINQLSIKQLEAILLHELAHIKRNDYLVNLYIAIIEILFFFNPFARLLVKAIKQEREKSCDDWVLQFRFEPYQYASALLALEKSRSVVYSMAVTAAGEKKSLLLQRVQRIMGIKKAYPESGFKLVAYFVTIGLLGFIALVNPGNLVVENFDTTLKKINYTGPALYTSKLGQSPALDTSNSKLNVVSNSVEQSNVKKNFSDPSELATLEADDNNEETPQLLPVSIDDQQQENATQAIVIQSDNNDNKDFSIKETDPEPPATASTNDYPFVPNSSYSFYKTDDTILQKLRTLKNSAPQVRESLAQAKKALGKIDLTKIAKMQNLSKTATIKLQKELEKSLQNLNWSQIYTETMDSINKVTVEGMRSALKQDYEKVKNYKALEQQYHSIKVELQQQEEKYKKGAEIDIQEINRQVQKRKVIVYI